MERIQRGDAWTTAAFGGLLACAAGIIALTGGMPHAEGLAARYVLVVAVPIAVGLYAWREGHHARFGRLLVLIGFAWFLPALSASSDSLAFSVGRMAGWTVEVGLVYLILAFPTGRLTTSVDRWLAWAAAALIATLYLPTVLIAETFPQPSLWATCTDCPTNAFIVVGSEPGFLDAAIVPLRDALTILLMVAVTVRLGFRVLGATPLMRRTLAPVLVIALARVVVFGVAVGVRRIDPTVGLVDTLTWAIVLGLPAMAIGFLIGLVRWRLFTADALLRLAIGIRHDPHPAELRDLIATALSDPSVEIAYRDRESPSGWVDADGEPVALPHGVPGRCCTEVVDDGRSVAALVHDDALSEQGPFVEAVGSYALTWEDNHRLAARVEESLRELRESRARILAAADDERRRIERDLHDGGQQRLVALRVRLELADQLMQESPARARRMLHQLVAEADATLAELRSLAAGVYPSLLADRGLTDALRSAARRSPVPVSVVVDGDGDDRYPREVEAAVYFCCLEALQNVAKHAPQASSVSISLQRDGDLRFTVRDDGPGFSPNGSGNGLINMRDRVAAVGGTLEIVSEPGAGTEVVGSVPTTATA